MTAAYTMMFNDLMHPINPNKIMRQKLKKAIEADGMLTLEEAKLWYNMGDGSPITVDADKIDLNFVDVSKLKMNEFEDVQTFGRNPQGFVYGGIRVKRIGNNQVTIKRDEYNFEMHSWLEEPKRNIETLLGRAYNGSGKSFYIYFRGVNTIHYDPYRHMNPYQYYPSPYFCPLR